MTIPKLYRKFSALLALTLALSLVVPAFAAGSDTLTRGRFVTALFELSGEKDTQARQEYFSDVPAACTPSSRSISAAAGT